MTMPILDERIAELLSGEDPSHRAQGREVLAAMGGTPRDLMGPLCPFGNASAYEMTRWLDDCAPHWQIDLLCQLWPNIVPWLDSHDQRLLLDGDDWHGGLTPHWIELILRRDGRLAQRRIDRQLWNQGCVHSFCRTPISTCSIAAVWLACKPNLYQESDCRAVQLAEWACSTNRCSLLTLRRQIALCLGAEPHTDLTVPHPFAVPQGVA